MKVFNRRLAVMMLKMTTSYRMGQIGYVSNPDQIIVYTKQSNYGNFLATKIIQLFQHPFNTYIHYNKDKKRCELIIY